MAKTITSQEFVTTYLQQGCDSRSTAAVLGLSYQGVYGRCRSLRKRGVKLPVARRRTDVGYLNDIIRDYRQANK